MARRLINLANGLTLSRFAFAPVALWLLLHLPQNNHAAPWVAPTLFCVMIVTILTDLFDGMTARAYKTVTNFGKIMDPVADSTFFMTVLFGYAASPRFTDWFPIWFPVLVLWREVAMHVLRRYAALRGIVLAAKMSGKAKMAVQSVMLTGFAGLLAVSDLGWMPIEEKTLGETLFYSGLFVVLVNLLSLIEYMREVPKLIDEWNET